MTLVAPQMRPETHGIQATWRPSWIPNQERNLAFFGEKVTAPIRRSRRIAKTVGV